MLCPPSTPAIHPSFLISSGTHRALRGRTATRALAGAMDAMGFDGAGVTVVPRNRRARIARREALR